ncbi:hypothetical protein RB595_004731 [Gaeumannomyces hyphopodioides]
MAFSDFSSIPLPPAYTEHFDEDGIAYYFNQVTKTTWPLHPGKLKALQDVGALPSPEDDLPDFIRDVDSSAPAAFWAAVKADADAGRPCRETAFMPGDGSWDSGEEYYSYGVLPPWVLLETTVPPPGSGLQPRPYWVGYGLDIRYPSYSQTHPLIFRRDTQIYRPAARPPPYFPAVFVAGPGHKAPCQRYSNLDFDELDSEGGLCLGSPIAIEECGCGFCAEISGQLGKCSHRWLHKQPRTDPSARQEETVVLRASFWQEKLYGLRVEYQTRIPECSGSYHKCETELPIASWQGSSMAPHVSYIACHLSDPGSPEQLRLALGWIDTCTREHENCRPSSSSHDFVPSRLLDVSDPSLLKLVEPSTIHLRPESYIALSYCWGKQTQEAAYVTTPENLAQRKHGFSERELPPTVRDAAVTTRGLNVRYLWVDALCIMQGPSPEARADWEAEAGRMSDIYNGACLTLVAAAAGSVYEGLFHSIQRNRASYTEVVLRSTLRPEYNGAVRLGRHQKYQRSAMMMPLYGRGWALQERVLSRRLLIYNSDQIVWECQQAKETESDASMAGLYSMRLPAGDGVGSATAAELRECWDTLVRDFCNCDISIESDKLPAIAGLARALHSMGGMGGDKHLAGMWRSCLVDGLLWATQPVCRQKRGIDSEVKTGLPARYRAPSWSWAAVDGPLKAYPFNLGRRYFRVLGCVVTPRGRDDFGEVSNGVLKVRGPLLDMSSFVYWHFYDTARRRNIISETTYDTRHRLLGVREGVYLDSDDRLQVRIYFDGDSNRDLPGDSMSLSGFWFLRLSGIAFLVLQRSEEPDSARGTTYKRVGLACAAMRLWPEDYDELFKGCDKLFEGCTDETIEIV